jgi:hypothetical protein
MIRNINPEKAIHEPLEELVNQNIEVGMVEFTNKDDILPLSGSFEKVGNFELDILAIDKETGEVVMLDHDQPDFIMGKVSKNLFQFVEALKPIEKFIEDSFEDDSLYDDEASMRNVTAISSSIAGGNGYQWFYNIIFGI